jgi:hypothetical protein
VVTALILLPFAAATLSVLLAAASVKKPTVATWCFFAGMLLLQLKPH